GASEVFVAASSRKRLDEAVRRELILPEAALLCGDGPRGETRSLRDRANVVIVTANGKDPLCEGVGLVADGGTLLLFGGLGPGDDLAGLDLFRVRRNRERVSLRIDSKTISLLGSHGTGYLDFARSLELLHAGALGVERLITHVVPFDDF